MKTEITVPNSPFTVGIVRDNDCVYDGGVCLICDETYGGVDAMDALKRVMAHVQKAHGLRYPWTNWKKCLKD